MEWPLFDLNPTFAPPKTPFRTSYGVVFHCLSVVFYCFPLFDVVSYCLSLFCVVFLLCSYCFAIVVALTVD